MNTEADMAATLGGACRGNSATSGVNRRRPAWRWVRATEAAGAQHRRSIAAGLTARWRRREAFLGQAVAAAAASGGVRRGPALGRDAPQRLPPWRPPGSNVGEEGGKQEKESRRSRGATIAAAAANASPPPATLHPTHSVDGRPSSKAPSHPRLQAHSVRCHN